MGFRKKINKNEIIFTIENEIVDDFLCDSIVSELSGGKKAGIDMRHVNKIEGKNFTKYLLENKYKLFNIKNEVLAYLAIVLKGGALKSFMNREDFFENKRELIRRKFVVV